jgi:uncharacterized membrane protein YccC
LIALMILLAYDLANGDGQGITPLLSERVVDMLLGCAIALVGTAAAFARPPTSIEEAGDPAAAQRSDRPPPHADGSE